ncbi:OFA family MFS transporter [Mycolicibacterium goodii]|uniref:OFA family MFS transporter n=1 Tax=Mycolicibacterium goodii TaxID=134601 RepID=A0ABS6HUR4_MYCGD|nr:OFA family MFS transporter [Mycolicibacterium goodii]OKH73661.1 MFS transporter [Mycobacterium sp. SWH-M5]MBU8810679.1 OFA family MFS transporter [Mycolicibacterium goodii]MBU8819305.1 OFA family MFS transporter [Mycolicibacterium goodii]MBU8826424.1 OFA family MFS transporter [Mycolicibacterium goodii]MBU8833558.1 OFA family MFS transporter [Mycolicibacterium goodii]
MSSALANYREITDANNRVYRVGESDREILGRSRAWMVWLPWLAMMAVSVYEYGYGAAEEAIRAAHGWSMSETFWLLAIWALFQAGIAFPAGKLREKGIVSARAAMLIGAVLSALGFVTLTQGNLFVAYLGFAVCGGIGAGLVYATCINMVGKWYPERRGGKTGFVNGGFAYGAVPFIFIFSYALHPSTYVWVLDLVGAYMLVVIVICGMLFRDPPKNWWPESVDPLQWANSKSGAKSLLKNPPAVRQYTPMEAIKTGMLPLMWLSLGISAGVSLFGSSYMVPFAKELGFGPLIAASSAGVLSVINGTGRGATGWVSDRLGRKLTLILVLLVSAVALVGLLYAGQAHNEVLFLFFAFLVGFGGGAFYPMFASLTPDYFGENNNASNYGLVYSSKLLGSVVGIGVGASVIDSWGYAGAYWLAAASALVSAGIAVFLHQPGRRNGAAVVPDSTKTTSLASAD